MKRHLATLAAAVALTVVAATAWAYWSAGSEPGGNGAAAATTVNQGATPTANAVGTTVTVNWTATTLASGTAVSGYFVKRYHSSTGVLQTILSACTGTITALSCVESSVPAGSWKYTVTPTIGTNWVGQESSQSGTVTVTPPDSTAPFNDVTLSSVTGGAYKSGTNVYYRGSAIGSFTLTNAVTDAGSGPASSQTAALGNTPTNWSHTGSTVSTPAGGPYVSNTFSWTAGATSSPTEAVTGRDVTGNTAVTNLSFLNDSTAPSTGTITYTNGYQPGHSVPVTFTTGTDGGSGIATRQLQRDIAPLTGGICGTWAGFSNRGPDSPTSIFTDSAVVAGTCYMYRYVVTDRVGNQHIATSANVSKVDYAGAVNATTGLLSHWRLGEAAASLTSSDSFNGTDGALLPARSGEIGATWVNPSGNSNMKIGSQNRAYRNASGYAIMYTTATPSSADYSVEADLHYKGTFASIAGGVIGRFNTSNTSFYMARWENDETWNIVKWSSGAPAWLNSSAVQPNLTVGETYRVKLTMTGSSLQLYVNGVLKASAIDATITAAGKAGIMAGEAADAAQTDSTGIQYENFQVTPSTYPRAADSKGTNTGDYKNGVTLGATGALTGDANTAGQFDGLNDYVQMTGTTGIPIGATSRSVEAWFKTSSATRQVIVAYGSRADTQEFGLWLDPSGTTMQAWGFGGGHDKTFTMPGGVAVNNGAWHQMVLTYNGTTLTLYIDGVALPTQAATRATVMDQYGFGIGAIINPSDGNSGGFFNGSIDEVSFYSSVLSQADVTNHYQLGTVTVPEPIITTTGTDLAYIENGTSPLVPAITVTDADSSNLTAATITMTTNYLNGQDTLAFTNQAGITGTWTAGTGVMALSGTATVAQYQTALRSITYNNNSDYPNTSTRTVTLSVSDGTNTSNTALKNITVTAVNDAPSGADGSATVDEDAASSFATADFGMTDPTDNGAHTLTAVRITTVPSNGTLKLSGVTVTAGQTVSAANIASGLLTYTPPLNANGAGYASFTFQVQDNGGTANSGVDLDASANTFTVNVAAVNDAPVNSVPATQATLPNTAKVFSTSNGNLISISDVDAAAATVQAQVVSTNGATTLSGTTGLSFSVGDGTADATMAFTGTITAINTALAGLSFNPTAAFTGTASLQIVTSDQANTGAGGTLTDSDTITINVSGRPVVTATVANLAFTENGASVALDAGITVTDPDSNITGATISMTTNYVSGQDTLSFTTQNGITGNWVAGTGVLTLTGTTTGANYQTALRSITYGNSSENPATSNRNVNFVVSDAIGAGNTSSRQVAVSAVNDAPINSVPAAQSTATNTAKVFSTGNGNLISVTDVDAAGGTMQVQLVSTNGATTLSTLTGLTFTVGDGTADATMTFTGSFAAVNTALSGLSFNPTTSFNGAASLQIVTSDQGNTGTGGTLSDTDTITITVATSCATQMVTNGGFEGGTGWSQTPAGTITTGGAIAARTGTWKAALGGQGADQTETVSQSVTIPAGCSASLSYYLRVTSSETGGPYDFFRVQVNTTTLQEYNDLNVGGSYVLRTLDLSAYAGQTVSLRFLSDEDGSVITTFWLDDVSLTGTAVVAPVVTASVGTTAHTENVPLAVDTGITVTDADSATMASGTVTVGSGYTAGQDVLAFTNQNGISGSYSAPTLTLTGSATTANWQTALRSITYNNTSDTPNTGNRTINFVVNDGSSNSNTGAKTVSVAAVNDAPVNSVPGAQSTSMNVARVFSTGNGNLISVTDVDAAGGTMQVQLVSTNGATTLSTLTGLTFSVGDGTADATMTFTGSFAAVNTALAGLSFNPTTSFTGAASLQIVTADQGNTGSGGTLTDTDTIAITVGASYFDTIWGTTGLVNYYRLGEGAISSDAMAGTAAATLQSRAGEIGANWTKHPISTADAVLTSTNRVRKSGTTAAALYYASGMPASADYTVESDLYVATTNVASDAAGVVGRLDPNNTQGTYYLMRYEQAGQAWSLFSVVNNSWSYLAGAGQTLAQGQTYRMALDMKGSTIRMLVDGVQIASVTNSSITAAGKAGIMLGGAGTTTDTDGTGYHLDSFRVSPPVADSKGTNHGNYFGGVGLGTAGVTSDGDTVAQFDGVNDFASVARAVSTNFTIEFWFKSTQGLGSSGQWPQFAGMVDNNVTGTNNDFGVALSAAGYVVAGVGNPDTTIVSAVSGFNDGTWHHVAFTRTQSTGLMTLYVDGVSRASGNGSTNALTAVANINFGRNAAGTNYYQGNLDEIAIYNTALSGATITAHYNAR